MFDSSLLPIVCMMVHVLFALCLFVPLSLLLLRYSLMFIYHLHHWDNYLPDKRINEAMTLYICLLKKVASQTWNRLRLIDWLLLNVHRAVCPLYPRREQVQQYIKTTYKRRRMVQLRQQICNTTGKILVFCSGYKASFFQIYKNSLTYRERYPVLTRCILWSTTRLSVL